MTLTLGPILHRAGIKPHDAQVIRHAFVREHEDTGLQGNHADSSDKAGVRGRNGAMPA